MAELTQTEALLTTSAATAVTGSDDLESIARPFLELLHVLTTLESTYLTEIHWDRGLQEIRYSDNRGFLQLTEGLQVPWQDTVCRLALQHGPRYSVDVPADFAAVPAVEELGIQTYISVPVTDHRNEVIGTLCGASDRRVAIPENVHSMMEMFARLIGDQWERDHSRKQAEQRAQRAEQQLEERMTYLATAEHQLKTPLTVLKGWAMVLDTSWDEVSEDQRRKGISAIAQSSESLVTQIEDLLQSARSAVLINEIQLTSQCITPIVERVGNEFGDFSAKHTINLFVGENCRAFVDKTALWQVLIHLVENAIKYSPNGGTVTISAKDDGDNVVISVVDQGVGIPSDINIFRAFTRSEESRFADLEGTGVGLHVVASLVDAMHGTVTAARNPDGGSTFLVRLPRHAHVERPE